jgi:hypothetical protein
MGMNRIYLRSTRKVEFSSVDLQCKKIELYQALIQRTASNTHMPLIFIHPHSRGRAVAPAGKAMGLATGALSTRAVCDHSGVVLLLFAITCSSVKVWSKFSCGTWRSKKDSFFKNG